MNYQTMAPAKTTERGYDAKHQARRKAWAPIVARGEAHCAKCGRWIPPGTPWDLGHTSDRTGWTGPEHRYCNRAAGGRNARRKQQRRRRVIDYTTRW